MSAERSEPVGLLPRPFAVVRLLKLMPPSVEMLRPPFVAAYTVLPEAKAFFAARRLGNSESGAVGKSNTEHL